MKFQISNEIIEKDPNLLRKRLLNPNLVKFKLENLVRQTVEQLFNDVGLINLTLEYPNDISHGDYSCNIAMRLAKQLGQNPREIAEKIKDSLNNIDFIKEIKIEGPGFINFWLDYAYLNNEISKIIKEQEDYGKSKIGNGDVVMVDLSAVNIAKPMSVGHLRSTIIGDSIKKIYSTLGYKAIGDNHLGDYGTQFGKLIYAFKKWGDKEKIEQDPIPELLKLYVRFHDEAEKDDELNERAREEFARLEKGNAENRELWQWLVDESMKTFEKIYKKLGVFIEETLGESFYEDMLEDAVNLLLEKGIAEKNDDNSIAINFKKHGIDLPSCLIQKKDGSTLYMTRDIATIQHRVDFFKAKKAIYVVGNEQTLHFKQLFAISRLLGYDIELKHVGFGLIRLKEGKISTRKGRIIYLEQLIKESEEKVIKVLRERNVNFPDDEFENLVHILSIGAIKYNDLSQNRMTEIVFDWDKMLSFEGNSAPYLQYTYARGRSILRKALKYDAENAAELKKNEEIDVARLLVKYSEVLLQSAQEYKPNLLAEYLFELTQKFNSFYNSLQVLNVDDEKVKNMRLALVEAVTVVLKNGLELLGIEVPERM